MYGESNDTIAFQIDWPWKVKSQGHSDFEALDLVISYPLNNIR